MKPTPSRRAPSRSAVVGAGVVSASVLGAALALASPASAAPPAAQEQPSWGCATKRAVTDVEYSLNGSPFRPLSGRLSGVGQSTELRISFRVADGCENLQLSLAAYEAPAATFDAQLATAQELFASDSRTFSSGPGMLTVQMPACFFQVDFARGPVLEQLGPAGTANFYGAQDRLLAWGTGGVQPCTSVLPRTITRPEAAPGTAGQLPRTGTTLQELVGLGAALVVVGAWITAAARRRRPSDAL
jgi:hypothetical protein